MRKILVEVYLPAALKSYDILIPEEMKIAQAAGLIGGALEQLSGNLYCASSTPMLCDRETGEILGVDMTIGELDLYNGSRLMLI